MSVNSYQQRDDDFLLGKANRIVLPPSRHLPGSDSNKVHSFVLDKLPSLVPEILLSSLQEGRRIQLLKGNTLCKSGLLRTSAQSDTTEGLSPVRRVSHRTVLPKISSDASGSQSRRRVVLPQGKSKASRTTQAQPDLRVSTPLQTMARKAYEEELEFLKLKLRYMQNDIEFKRRQIDNAKLMKLKNSTAVNKWNQSSKMGLVQGGTRQVVEQTASSQVLPGQCSMFHNRSPSSAWAAAAVRLSQTKTAANKLQNSSNLQGSGVPSSAPTTNHRFVMGPTKCYSLVTGCNKSSLTTSIENNKFCVATGISKSSCESTKASLVTGSNKSSMAAESNKHGLVTESMTTSLAAGSNKSCITAKNNTSCLITESNKSSMVTGNKKYGLANGSNSSLTANLLSSQLSPGTTLSKWKPTTSSADVRTVFSAGERAAPNLTSTTCTQYVNSMAPLQRNIAHFHTAHKKTEEATLSPADPSVVLCGLNKEIPFSHPEAASGNSTSIFDRLGSQRVSEMPKIVHESPDKRLVVSSKVAPAVVQVAPVASDLTQTIGSTSLATVASEAFTNHSLDTSGENITDVANRQGPSHAPRTEYCSDSDLIWKQHSVAPASKYKFVKNHSGVNVDTANTSTAYIVKSVMLPSSPKYFTSLNTLSDKDVAAATRGSPISRLNSRQADQSTGSPVTRLNSFQNPMLNIPPAAEVVNKYKLKRRSPTSIPQAAAQLFPNKRLSPASVPQAASQFYPVKMLLQKSSPAANQADSKSLNQSAKIQHKFVSKYSLIKTPPRTASISNNAAPCGINSVTLPSLSHDSYMYSNSSLSTQPVMAAAARRPSQGSRLGFRNPNLKIHTAAKLVSKYKLKRMSPTSTPQAAPQFHNRLLYKPATVHNLTGIKVPGQYSRNQLKLDRRLVAMNTANAKVSYKKLGDEYSKLSVLTQKHKIDRRPAMSQSPKVHDDSLSPCKFTVDERRKADIFLQLQATGPVCASRNVLDRRVSKAGLFKLQMVADRHIKHCWAGPQPVAAAKVRPGTRRSSMYSWKKPCLPAAQSSRFKWSRPNVQAQNEAWQQLRQKLQLLLLKKHRHSRYNFFKYPTMVTAPKAYNRRSQVGDYSTNLVTIDGVTYKSSTCKLMRTRRLSSGTASKRLPGPAQCTPVVGSGRAAQRQTMKLISLRGVHFHVDRSGKKLCRTQPATASGALATEKKSASSHADVNVVNFANRVIHRSIAITTAKYKKNNQKSKKPYCKFFSRFGKCHRGDNCPYVHDPEKVAVCTRFLRGRCEVKDCPFSHKASVNKMPVCLFFLRGSCSRDSCPYLHVRVNPSAPVCKDFRNGFCALGEKCKKIHSHVCPSFAMTRVCSRAGTCTMLHRASRKDQEPPSQDKPLIHKSRDPSTNSPSHPGKSTITPDFTVPLAAQPSFISLGITPTAPAPLHMTSSAKAISCLGTTSMPSFISLETTPTPSFISLETTPAPSFISFEARQQEGIHKKQTSNPSDRKSELTPGKDGSNDLELGQDVSSTGTLLNIRPSFMTKRMSAQNS
ncbi:hypothetical protein BsWGS_22480 [Bradybaena similaris]